MHQSYPKDSTGRRTRWIFLDDEMNYLCSKYVPGESSAIVQIRKWTELGRRMIAQNNRIRDDGVGRGDGPLLGS